ncbi:terpene synthase family protein [Nocardia sp. NPDC051570]|uniref:terpene synthase family protein n=1 Tax=Nocardia sp. NPDC051570 TaxID=3364324 RepID=UPI0037893A25
MDTYNFTIPAGTVYHLPEIRTDLPEDCHPRCGELEEHANAFARPYLIAYFGDEDRADRYLGQGHPHYACTGFPRTLEDRVQALCDSILPATLLDDSFSKPGLQDNLSAAREHHARWSAIFAGEPPLPEADPEFFFVHEALQACTAHASPGLAVRLRAGWQDVADAFLEEAIRRHRNETLDLESYAERRVKVHFRQWMVAHLEFSLGIDLGALADHPLIRSAQNHTVWHVALTNDCHSLVKELSANESTNAIIELIRHDRMDLQAAVDKVVALIHQAEQDYLQVRDDIRRNAIGDNADVIAFVDGLAFLASANLRWCQRTTRYHGLDHDGSQVLPGPVTIKYLPTVHTPREEFDH